MRASVPVVRSAVVGALACSWIAVGCSATRTSEAPARPAPAVARPAPPAPGALPASRPAPDSPRGAAAPLAAAHALRGETAPVWQVGDQWAFRWESADGHGDYVWTVDRLERIAGVEHYVIRTGSREIFLRTSDLATSLERAAERVERRNTPARLAFSWPLAAGATWRQRYTEEGDGRATSERRIAWKVEGEEDVRVEAGTFKALHIVARHDPTPAVMYEMWYAPEAKQWIRLKEHFPNGVRYRELTALNLRS
jgi:hypothetical protein